jgi:hypothetical protein
MTGFVNDKGGMAEATTEASFRSAKHTAFVLGYTGEVGKELVKVND